MQFARDPVAAATVQQWIGEAASTWHQSAWCLVDPSLLDTDRVHALFRRFGVHVHNALETTPFAAYGKAAPHFFECQGFPQNVRDCIAQVIAINPSAPAFSLIRTVDQLNAFDAQVKLKGVFAYLAATVIDSDMDVFCRFADTRVLSSVFPVLKHEQMARVSKTVAAWLWLDGYGAVQRMESSHQAGSVVDESPKLELDGNQFNAMLSASEPDTMFHQLQETTPELVPERHGAQFRWALESALEAASRRGVEQPTDRFQWIVLSLSLGLDFHKNPLLASTWDAVAAGQSTLIKASAEWSDRIWDDLDSKKQPFSVTAP